MEDLLTKPSFPETRWTVLLDLRDGSDLTAAKRAINHLCTIYWKPIYARARMLGNSAEDAEDLTQSFFVHVLEDKVLAKADSKEGRLRSFLLKAFENHTRNLHRRSQAQKRGRDTVHLSLDEVEEVEREIEKCKSHSLSADLLFDRQCAVAIVQEAVRQLQREQENAGLGPIFHLLRGELDPSAPRNLKHDDIAAQLGVSRSAVSVALLRFRKRFREILRMLIKETLHDPTPEAVDEELRSLRKALEY